MIEGWRTIDGLEYTKTTVPLGVVGLAEPDLDTVADCVLAANTAVVTGLDVTDIRKALANAGLPEDVVVGAETMPSVELDALLGSGELLLAERVGIQSSIYVDIDAVPHQATYVAVNAVAHAAVDTIVVHQDFEPEATADLQEALGYAAGAGETEPQLVTASSMPEAARVVDELSAGRVETIVSANVTTIAEFGSRVDSGVLVVNASPAFVDPSGPGDPDATATGWEERELIGLTRTRVRLAGDGHTKPLPAARRADLQGRDE